MGTRAVASMSGTTLAAQPSAYLEDDLDSLALFVARLEHDLRAMVERHSARRLQSECGALTRIAAGRERWFSQELGIREKEEAEAASLREELRAARSRLKLARQKQQEASRGKKQIAAAGGKTDKGKSREVDGPPFNTSSTSGITNASRSKPSACCICLEACLPVVNPFEAANRPGPSSFTSVRFGLYIGPKGDGHPACLDCAADYVQKKLENRSPNKVFPVLCPAQQCDDQLTDVDAARILGESDLHSWHHHKPCDAQPSLICANQRCARRIVRRDDFFNPRVVCPYCLQASCGTCMVIWHKGCSCEDYQSLPVENRNPEVALLTLARSQTLSRCSGCKTLIENTGRCLKVTCPLCKIESCYRCGSSWYPLTPAGRLLNHYRLPSHDGGTGWTDSNGRSVDLEEEAYLEMLSQDLVDEVVHEAVRLELEAEYAEQAPERARQEEERLAHLTAMDDYLERLVDAQDRHSDEDDLSSRLTVLGAAERRTCILVEWENLARQMAMDLAKKEESEAQAQASTAAAAAEVKQHPQQQPVDRPLGTKNDKRRSPARHKVVRLSPQQGRLSDSQSAGKTLNDTMEIAEADADVSREEKRRGKKRAFDPAPNPDGDDADGEYEVKKKKTKKTDKLDRGTLPRRSTRSKENGKRSRHGRDIPSQIPSTPCPLPVAAPSHLAPLMPSPPPPFDLPSALLAVLTTYDSDVLDLRRAFQEGVKAAQRKREGAEREAYRRAAEEGEEIDLEEGEEGEEGEEEGERWEGDEDPEAVAGEEQYDY